MSLNNDEFDRDFIIKIHDESFARNLLGFSIQNKFLVPKQHKPRRILKGTWLIIAILKVIKIEEGYDQLINLSFAAVDRLQEL